MTTRKMDIRLRGVTGPPVRLHAKGEHAHEPQYVLKEIQIYHVTPQKRITVIFKFVLIGYGQHGDYAQTLATGVREQERLLNVLLGSIRNVLQLNQIAKRKIVQQIRVLIGYGVNGNSVPLNAGLGHNPE